MNSREDLILDFLKTLDEDAIIKHTAEYIRASKGIGDVNLKELAHTIASDFHAIYKEESTDRLQSYLDDFCKYREGISYLALALMLIGGSDEVASDVPLFVLNEGKEFLQYYNSRVKDAEHECQCGNNCGACGSKDNQSEELEEERFDVPTLMLGLLEDNIDILVKEHKVPYTVVLSMAEMMDNLSLTESEFRDAIERGIFDGEVIVKSCKEAEKEYVDESEEESKQKDSDDFKITEDVVERVMRKSNEDNPGLHKQMKRIRQELVDAGIDIDAYIVDCLKDELNSISKLIRKDIDINIDEVYKLVLKHLS